MPPLRDLVLDWQRGVQAVARGDWGCALRLFSGVPGSPAKMCFNVGCVHLLAGDPNAALRAFDQAVAKDVYLAVGFFQRGVANFQLERSQEALSDFQVALAQLRGNTTIDYTQLGLRFKLQAWEEQCALQPRSVPRGEVFRPLRWHLENLQPMDFLGKAKVVVASGVGPQQPQVGGRHPSAQHFARRFAGQNAEMPLWRLGDATPALSPPWTPSIPLTGRGGELSGPVGPESVNTTQSCLGQHRQPSAPPPPMGVWALSGMSLRALRIRTRVGEPGPGQARGPATQAPAEPIHSSAPGHPPVQSWRSDLARQGGLTTTRLSLRVSRDPARSRLARRLLQGVAAGDRTRSVAVTVQCAFTLALEAPRGASLSSLRALLSKALPAQAQCGQLSYREPGDNGCWVPLHEEQVLQQAWRDVAPSPAGLQLRCWAVDGRPVLRQAVARHSYSAQRPEDLDLQPGDTVDILCGVDQAWLEGHCDGRVGIFPECFVVPASRCV